MVLALRPTSTDLAAGSRALAAARDQLVDEWADWILKRLASVNQVKRGTLERQLRLLVDLFSETAGPSRRRSRDLWLSAAEWYGRAAAQRGLATGEIVEEFQYLRELLIRHLSELILDLPPRRSMATVLRLNRLLDEGVAHAVVGYTDALVETLLNQRGVPVGALDEAESAIEKRLHQFERELLAARRGR